MFPVIHSFISSFQFPQPNTPKFNNTETYLRHWQQACGGERSQTAESAKQKQRWRTSSLLGLLELRLRFEKHAAAS
ncbi:hypothetical protein ACFX13_020354 [Malus domestica]